MSRETIKYLVDMIPEQDIETIYRVLIRFVPEDKPTPDELQAIVEAKADNSPTIPHEAINWDQQNKRAQSDGRRTNHPICKDYRRKTYGSHGRERN